MDNVLKNHPTRHFDEIRFWSEWCQWYCTNFLKNKACWRLDIPCKNLWNCNTEYGEFYERKKSIYKITSSINEANEVVESIY